MRTAASSITQDIAASTAFGRLRPTDTTCNYACAKRYDKFAAIVIDHPVGAQQYRLRDREPHCLCSVLRRAGKPF